MSLALRGTMYWSGKPVRTASACSYSIADNFRNETGAFASHFTLLFGAKSEHSGLGFVRFHPRSLQLKLAPAVNAEDSFV